jgi:LysR family glycine cleavage system transcriptional activator
MVPIGAVHLDKTALSLDQLLKGPFIRILGQEADWVRYLAAHDLALSTGADELYVDTMTAAIELAANGGGYAVVLRRLVEMANATGARVSIIGTDVPTPSAHYLMRPKSKRSKRSVVLLFENWLREEFLDGEAVKDDA